MPGRITGVFFFALVLFSTGTRAQTASSGARHASANPCARLDFDGSVTVGQSFRKPIGNGLLLLLEAVPHGWVLRILPVVGPRPEQDFAEVATPPFHSVNPLLLTTDFGFRAQDVVGWNPRGFRFAATPGDFVEAQRAYHSVVSSTRPTHEQDMAVTRVAMRALEGQITLLDAVLVPGTGNQTPGAALVSSHFATTPHQFTTPAQAGAMPLGQILSLRFHVSLSAPRSATCR